MCMRERTGDREEKRTREQWEVETEGKKKESICDDNVGYSVRDSVTFLENFRIWRFCQLLSDVFYDCSR